MQRYTISPITQAGTTQKARLEAANAYFWNLTPTKRLTLHAAELGACLFLMVNLVIPTAPIDRQTMAVVLASRHPEVFPEGAGEKDVGESDGLAEERRNLQRVVASNAAADRRNKEA